MGRSVHSVGTRMGSRCCIPGTNRGTSKRQPLCRAWSQIESVIPNDLLACSAALDLPLSGIVDISGALDLSLADGRASRKTSGHPYPFFPLDGDGITQVCFAGGRDRTAT